MQERIHIILYLSITTLLILFLGGTIILVVYLYQQKRILYQQTYSALKLQHEKNLISTQLEVQENMFRHISQEIHDNIGLTLSLAKLQLNTLDANDQEKASLQIHSSVELLGESITHLKNISRSLNADIINSYGLTKAIENEIARISDIGSILIRLEIQGEPIYLDAQKELIIFRIIQESLNNILKHSAASATNVALDYNDSQLIIKIIDNGKGFIHSSLNEHSSNGKAGLKNMESRTKMIRGKMQIQSSPGNGTTLKFTIPL